MTVAEVLKQANALTPAERKELVIMLVETLDVAQPENSEQPAHWGQALNALLDTLEPVEFVDPEITDPVEWVKAQREKERKHRLGDWGEEE